VRATNTGFSLLHTRLRVPSDGHGFSPTPSHWEGTQLTHRPGRLLLFAVGGRVAQRDRRGRPSSSGGGPTSVLIRSPSLELRKALAVLPRRLKPLKGLTPYEFHLQRQWTKRTTRIHSQSAPANAGLITSRSCRVPSIFAFEASIKRIADIAQVPCPSRRALALRAFAGGRTASEMAS